MTAGEIGIKVSGQNLKPARESRLISRTDRRYDLVNHGHIAWIIVHILLVATASMVLCGCAVPRARLAFSGGDGESLEQEVSIQGAKDESSIIRGERAWIMERYPGTAIMRRNIVFDPQTGSPFDEVIFMTIDGKLVTVYFSNPFGNTGQGQAPGNK